MTGYEQRIKGYGRKRIVFCAFILIPAILFSVGCGEHGEKIPDVSKIEVSLKTYRFDKDIYGLDTNHLGTGLQQLSVKYPDFLNYFLDTLMAFGIWNNYTDTAAGVRSLDTFITNKDYANLEDTIKIMYPDCKEQDMALTEGFRFVKYYLPDYQVPRVFYLNMGLAKWGTFPVDNSTLCVGLDMFLGENYPHYKDVGVPSYMGAHFRKSYLPVSFFKTVYQTLKPFNQDDKTLLDLMIQRGKEQYFLHKVLPHTPDSVLFGFTGVQLKWCSENEGLAYNFFIHQKLLYSKEGHAITPYVYDGPFAKDLESPAAPVKMTPGNIGSWLGYRIVSAYMATHPTLTLKDLLKDNTDPAAFLESAKYRPK